MDAALRRVVRQWAGGRCEYCHLPEEFSELSFHVEHIIPRQHGGTDDPENLALACPECNLRKGPNLTAIEPAKRKVVRLFHPRQDKWNEHFAYRGARIAGKTSIGLATASLLRINDEERLRIRALLVDL
jgi:5-methylcytosine-specific restriction endonuclease McrA